MKKSAFTLLAFLAMTSVTLASVTLGIDDNGPVGTGLNSYTITATGVGITTLSQFTIGNEVNQVFNNSGFVDYIITASEWLGDGSATGHVEDSYVIFGDQRIDGYAYQDTDPVPSYVTLETINTQTNPPTAGGDDSGPGALNNYDETGGPGGIATWDAYLKNNAAALHGAAPSTVDLIQLVVADTTVLGSIDDITGFTMTLYTATDYEYVGGDVDNGPGESTVTRYDFPSVAPPLGGDADLDEDVDLDDLALLGANWGVTSGAVWGDGDFDGDEDVDLDDLAILGGNWGVGTFAAVPEPSTIIMLILGALCLVGYRVRK